MAFAALSIPVLAWAIYPKRAESLTLAAVKLSGLLGAIQQVGLASLVPDAKVVSLPVPKSMNVGSLAGAAGVQGGNAAYSISIPVPPGRAGLQPAVQLRYDSGAGEGLLGVGWSMNVGADSVDRCAKIVAVDGQNSAPRLSGDDPLCWNGQRLVVVSGVYGSAGSEYRTEVNDFARVQLLGGGIGSASSYFKVTHKSGLVEVYATRDIYGGGKASVPFSWFLSRAIDVDGNTINYGYSTSTGEVLITSIRYTGYNNAIGNRRIEFEYATRPRISERYYLQERKIQARRLKSIRTYVGSDMVNLVLLRYKDGGSIATGRSLLESVRLCADVNCTNSYPETKFQYNDHAITWDSQMVGGAEGALKVASVSADYDGDGVGETLIRTYPNPWGGSSTSTLLRSSRTGAEIDLGSAWDAIPGSGLDGASASRVTDFNLDGLPDLIGSSYGKFAIATWNPISGAFQVRSSVLPWSADALPELIGDLNADGRADLVESSSGKYRIHFNCTERNASQVEFCSYVELPFGPAELYAEKRMFGSPTDLDGDGLSELLLMPNTALTGHPGTVKLLQASRNGGVISYQIRALTDLGGVWGSGSGDLFQFIDVNGDGLPDILDSRIVPAEGVRPSLWINSGGTFRNVPLDSSVLSYDDRREIAFPMDHDGDGLAELMLPEELIVNYCYQMHYNGDDTTEPLTFCSNGANGGFRSNKGPGVTADRGVYRYDSLKFEPLADGGYRIARKQTGLVAMANRSRVVDFNGDGLDDVMYTAHVHYAPVGPNGSSMPVGSFGEHQSVELGSHVVLNSHGKGAAFGVDRLALVIDGMRKQDQWRYSPLSGNGSSNCQYGAERPFYAVSHSAATGDRIHFGSSMSVVAEHLSSDGVGGMNSTCYRYENAMYSTSGRGFQGFQAIVADENLSDADNNKSVRTLYYDSFPLTGKAKRVETRLVSDPANKTPIAKVESTWSAHTLGGGIYFVYRATERSDNYDLVTRRLVSSKREVVQYQGGDVNFGNPTRSTVRYESYLDGKLAITNESEVRYAYDYGRVGEWWIDKVKQTTEIKKPTVYTALLSGPKPSGEVNAQHSVVTHYEWRVDGRRKLQKRTLQPGVSGQQVTQAFDYDTYGNRVLVATSSPGLEQRIQRVEYSQDGYFPARKENALGHVTQLEFDARRGELIRETSPGGITSENEYSALGAPIVTRIVNGGVPDVHRAALWCNIDVPCPAQAVSLVTEVADGKPVVTRYLDVLGRAIKTTTVNADGAPPAVVVSQYDHRGNMVRESKPSYKDAGEFFTNYEGFDALGRPFSKIVERTGHASERQEWLYEYRGPEVTIYLPDGELVASRVTDARGQIIQTTDAKGGITHYRHNGHGHQMLVRDPAGNEVLHYYDALARLTRVDDPNSGTPDRPAQLVEYDGMGDVRKVVDANGNEVRYRYDRGGRKIERLAQSEDGSLATDAVWEYDTVKPGLLTSARLHNGKYHKTFAYDELLRPKRTTVVADGVHTFVSEIDYDGYYGRPKAMRYPSGETVAFEYDAYGLLLSEADPHAGTIYWRVDGTDAAGRVRQAVFGNGLVGRYDFFESTGQSKSIQLRRPSGLDVPLLDLAYAYDDPFGNLTKRESKIHGVVESFEHDELQRLVFARRDWTIGRAPVEVSYEYDSVGNLTRKSDFGLYQYGDQGRGSGGNAGPNAVNLVQMPDGQVVSDFQYDDGGNLVSGNGRSLEYNTFNQPVRISEGGLVTSLHYTPDLELYKRVEQSRVTYYVGDSYQLVLDGPLKVERTFVSGSAVVEKQGGIRKIRYQHFDSLGSLAMVTDEAGQVTEEHGFDAFGAPREGGWTDNGAKLHSGQVNREELTERGFTGHEHLDGHRLVHMRGRVYDPMLGRFLTVDPFMQKNGNSQAKNPYSYVLNNPLSSTDPSGYECQAEDSGSSCAQQFRLVQQFTSYGRPEGSVATFRGDNSVTVTVTGNGAQSATSSVPSTGALNSANQPNRSAHSTTNASRKEDKHLGDQIADTYEKTEEFMTGPFGAVEMAGGYLLQKGGYKVAGALLGGVGFVTTVWEAATYVGDASGLTPAVERAVEGVKVNEEVVKVGLQVRAADILTREVVRQAREQEAGRWEPVLGRSLSQDEINNIPIRIPRQVMQEITQVADRHYNGVLARGNGAIKVTEWNYKRRGPEDLLRSNERYIKTNTDWVKRSLQHGY